EQHLHAGVVVHGGVLVVRAVVRNHIELFGPIHRDLWLGLNILVLSFLDSFHYNLIQNGVFSVEVPYLNKMIGRLARTVWTLFLSKPNNASNINELFVYFLEAGSPYSIV
ncbi:hypothetical protein ACJX0J_032268, partial [Zea mays]